MGLAVAWGLSACGLAPRHWRAPLGYLLSSVLAATLLVVAFKRYSGVDCPWDLFRYGGARLYVAPFSFFDPLRTSGACFPAGHASAGFAWVAACIAFMKLHPAWSRRALWSALATGAAGLRAPTVRSWRCTKQEAVAAPRRARSWSWSCTAA